MGLLRIKIYGRGLTRSVKEVYYDSRNKINSRWAVSSNKDDYLYDTNRKTGNYYQYNSCQYEQHCRGDKHLLQGEWRYITAHNSQRLFPGGECYDGSP